MKQDTINLDSAGIKLVSFDVFDTVITRICGAPEAIFRLVGEKLRGRGLLTISPRAFERMRSDAERRARRHKRPHEITLAEIYAELNRLWLLPETTLQEMQDCELQTERENIFAIPGAHSLLEQARRAGKRIAFVSDMYLPQDFLHSILVQLDLLKEGDALYVSSQWGVSKADGGLFPILLAQEKLAGREILHLGDSAYSDVKRAEEQGMRATHLTRGSLNRFETALARSEAEILESSGTLAGLSRRARLTADPIGAHFVAARLGASLAGPILTAYAEWVLRSAVKRKLQRLYFLARDGEALLRLCEVLAPAVGASEIELRYFYGSREVWSPAALVEMDPMAAAFFALQIAWTTSAWEDCVGYLGFAAEEINRTSLPRKWTSAIRNSDWKKQIFLDIAADPNLGPLLKSRLEEKASLAARYVSEQGLAGKVACGLVDCGWTGTWTDIIGELVGAHGGTKPLVFFLGRRRRAVPARCETLAWAFDQQAGSGLEMIPDFFHVVVEFLLTANHGRTFGFEEVNGRLRPKLAAVDWQGFEPESWQVFRSAMLNFAESYARQLKPDRETADLRAALNELVILFWEQPTVEEARFFAGHTIDHSLSRSNTQTLARPYGWGDVLRLALWWKLPGYPPFWWHEGAQALSGSAVRTSMGLMWQARELLRTLRDNGKGRLDAKGLARLFAASARKLKYVCERRDEHDFCRFESADALPKVGPKPLSPLAETASARTPDS